MNVMLEPQKYFSASIVNRNEMGMTGISEDKMADERLKKLLELIVRPEHNQDLNWLRLIQHYTNEIGDDFFLGGGMEKNGCILNHVLLMTERQAPVDINGAIRKINSQLVKDKYISNSLHRELLRNVSKANDSSSYKSFWEGIAGAISAIQKNYLNFYAGLMEDYVDMYQQYNDLVVKAAGQCVTAGSDANHVYFNGKDLRDKGYAPFELYIKDKPNVDISNWGNLTDSQKNDIKKNLSPAFNVSDKEGHVTFNNSSYWSLPHTPADISKDTSGQVSLPAYQAWLAQFNSVGNTFQSNMQSFAQTYSQVNNTFNNLNKILSSSITSLGESANFVLKSIS